MRAISKWKSGLALEMGSILALFFISIIKADPIGEVQIAGNTWCELQWQLYTDPMIAVDTFDGTAYFVWTYAPPPPYEYHRRSYFNSFNPLTGWEAGEPGLNMFPGVSNQKSHSILFSNIIGGRINLEFGLTSIDPYVWNMRAWWDIDHFESMQLDTIWYPEEWQTRRVFDGNSFIHNIAVGYANDPLMLYYSRYQIDPYVFSRWELVDTLTRQTYAIAISPVSDRMAIVYQKQRDFSGPQYYYAIDSDLFLIFSPDGVNWNWEDRINVTHFSEEDIFRPQSNLDVLFDYNNTLHLTFGTYEAHVNRAFPESTTANGYMTFIWHWSEATDSFSVVADGWIQNPPPLSECYFGVGMSPVCKPKLAVNPSTDYLYVLYERNDCDDCSFIIAHPNTDLWVAVSTDDGLNWSEGTNITSTHTPDCLPCQCLSEIQASINKIVNDTLHTVYIQDKYPGIWEYLEGYLCEAKVIYQRIPSSFIPTMPLIPQFSIRSDPTTVVRYENESGLPSDITLGNYPNPFNSLTTINYEILNRGKVDVSIYDLLGRKIAVLFSGEQRAGKHEFLWDASDFTSGVYFIKLETSNARKPHKIILLK